ncbi:MAG: sugar phosphate isomerase/epimerase [Armatimonadetes bacterium]|nr:sugar phosphate isomerase/epimerase [Armatimonadota bacterium]MDE2205406.1 sugar phosphate isomerase/epimerase [Armatimonadota bacterium]
MTDSDSVTVQIAVNGAFLTRRWEEPDNWMRLTRECGFPAHSFCADVLDPFFSGDSSFRTEQAVAARQAADRYGVTICDLYTGMATHRFHGLSHSDARARDRMCRWIEDAAGLAHEMGTDLVGGHWDALSVEVLANPVLRAEATNRLHETFRSLSRTLTASCLRGLMQEQMYIPSEMPWTLNECQTFLQAVNESRGDAVPVGVTLDVGHQAGRHYGLSGPDLDYGEWLRRFGACSEVIHLQQTTPDASHHWPFTAEFNRLGHIRMERVLETLFESHAAWSSNPISNVLPRAPRHWLVLEVIPGSTKTETALLSELTASAEYLRRYVPESGLDWSFNLPV